MGNILITSAGRRVSLVQAFQDSAKRLMPQTMVYACDLRPELSSACYIADKSFKVGLFTDANYIDSLLELAINENISLIVPTIDTELILLAENKLKFKEKNITVLISELSFVKMCRNKRLTLDFFKANKIDFAPEVDLSDIKEFPFFIRSISGSSSKNIFKIDRESEIQDWMRNKSDFLYQVYIPKTDFFEYTIDAYYNKNGILCCSVPRLRVETRTGEISKGITQKNILNQWMRDKLSVLGDVVGCLTIQVFVKNDKSKILGIEINPRFGGGYPMSHQAGAKFTDWVIMEYLLNEEIEYFNDWEENVLFLRYDQELVIRNYAY